MSTNNITTVYAGIDVAKAKLDLSFAGKRHCLANNPKGHRQLLAIITTSAQPVHAILEATGGYEAPLVKSLHRAQVPLSVLQPARVRYFARALNQHAKTDLIDADVLVDFGNAVRPAPAMPGNPKVQRLAELVTRRSQLVESKTQHGNQAEHYTDKFTLKQSRQMEALLEKQIAECDAAIASQIAMDAQLSARSERIRQVKGIGPVSASTLLAYMPELGTLSAEAAAALAGVAPFNNDSGPRKGARSIRGGRKEVRCTLYMAVMNAVRSDSVLKGFYLRLRAAGKKPLVALTAAMRKLIILLNHMLKKPDFKLSHPA